MPENNQNPASPYFSICTPVYNGEVFVRKAVDSVLRQTFHDWELVIIEDGSTDRTWDLLQEHYANHPQIRLVKNERNLGQRGNLNRCLEMAGGRWLGILAADDFYNPHALETIHAKTHGNDDLMLWIHEHLCFGENRVPNVPHPFSDAREFTAIELAELIYLKGNIFGELSNFFIRNGSLKNRPDCRFSDGTQTMDMRFWLRALMANPAGKAFFWPEVLTHVLIHEESDSSKFKKTNQYLIDFFALPADMASLGWRKNILLLQILRMFKCWTKLCFNMPENEKFKAFHTMAVLWRQYWAS